jgi:uncharacterized protein YcbX
MYRSHFQIFSTYNKNYFSEIAKGSAESALTGMFEIPVNYTQIDRKTTQDLKTNPKKRMRYANIQG